MRRIDYARMSYYIRAHHKRYKQLVEGMNVKLTCQECGGSGGETVPVLDYGEGPWEECGWCEGTGLVTPFLRGLWLRHRRLEKAHAHQSISMGTP